MNNNFQCGLKTNIVKSTLQCDWKTNIVNSIMASSIALRAIVPDSYGIVAIYGVYKKPTL